VAVDYDFVRPVQRPHRSSSLLLPINFGGFALCERVQRGACSIALEFFATNRNLAAESGIIFA